MAENPHYKEMLQALNEFEVEYLVVGGYAVMKYTEPRYTKDLDVWVHNSAQNSARLFQALAKFGAPLKPDGVTPETFRGRKVVYQIGVAPVRVDILTHIDGVEFTGAWRNRVEGVFFGVPVHLISLDDLIANKQPPAGVVTSSILRPFKRDKKEEVIENQNVRRKASCMRRGRRDVVNWPNSGFA